MYVLFDESHDLIGVFGWFVCGDGVTWAIAIARGPVVSGVLGCADGEGEEDEAATLEDEVL